MSKYGEIIKQARSGQSDGQDPTTQTPAEALAVDSPADSPTEDPFVNITARVRRSQRNHWGAEAKRRGLTITEVIIETLNTRFGSPPD